MNLWFQLFVMAVYWKHALRSWSLFLDGRYYASSMIPSVLVGLAAVQTVVVVWIVWKRAWFTPTYDEQRV